MISLGKLRCQFDIHRNCTSSSVHAMTNVIKHFNLLRTIRRTESYKAVGLRPHANTAERDRGH